MIRLKKIARWILLGGFIYTFLAMGVAMPYWGGACMREPLKYQRHEDHTMPGTKWLPRWTTCFCLPTPGPQAIAHSQGTEFVGVANGQVSPKPIPRPGEWHVAVVQVRPSWPFYLPYLAYTTLAGWHMRFGVRWDNIDRYYVPSVALHYLEPSEE